MALLLDQIEWDDPTVPLPPPDPAWEGEVRAVLGTKMVPHLFRVISRIRWLREALLDGQRAPASNTSERLQYLAVLVTSQESACRFCYGAARAQMRVLGFDEKFIERVERDAMLADDADQEVIRFCRNLSRSNPRPMREDALALQKQGLGAVTCAELAGIVALVCFHNRLGTLFATPPAEELERMPDSFMGRFLRPLIARSFRRRPAAPSYPEPQPGEPFASVSVLLTGSSLASIHFHIMKNAFAPGVLPLRTKALMFLIVARFLSCRTCETESRRLVERQGFPPEAVDEVLRTLASPALDPVERQLIPWVRDTVRIDQPGPLQRKTRTLAVSLGADVASEAIGIAGLANMTVRIAMLAE